MIIFLCFSKLLLGKTLASMSAGLSSDFIFKIKIPRSNQILIRVPLDIYEGRLLVRLLAPGCSATVAAAVLSIEVKIGVS